MFEEQIFCALYGTLRFTIWPKKRPILSKEQLQNPSVDVQYNHNNMNS